MCKRFKHDVYCLCSVYKQVSPHESEETKKNGPNSCYLKLSALYLWSESELTNHV